MTLSINNILVYEEFFFSLLFLNEYIFSGLNKLIFFSHCRITYKLLKHMEIIIINKILNNLKEITWASMISNNIMSFSLLLIIIKLIDNRSQDKKSILNSSFLHPPSNKRFAIIHIIFLRENKFSNIKHLMTSTIFNFFFLFLS